MNFNLANMLRRKPAPVAVQKAVDPEFLMSLGGHYPNTPDYYMLEKQKFQLLFVADEMMSGCRYNAMVENERGMRYGVAYTQDHMKMLKKDLGKATYPVIMPKLADVAGIIHRTEAAPVKGEVYIIESQQLVELDKYKNNGTVFERVRVNLDIPYRKVREHRRDAHITTLTEPNKTFKEVNTFRDVFGKDSDGNRTVQRKAVRYQVPLPQEVSEVKTMGRENVWVYDGEWEHFKEQSAWTYLAKPEYFFWNNYQESLKHVRMVRPADRNLKPFYFYSSKEDAE